MWKRKFVLRDEGGEAGAGAGGAPTDWRAALPEDIRTSPALKDVKDVGALAKNYLEAQSSLGRSIRMPSKEAGDEDRAAFRAKLLEQGAEFGVIAVPSDGEDDAPFYTALGRPAEATEYEVPTIDGQGMQLDETEVNQFRSIAHGAGVSKKQFKKVVEGMAKARLESALAAKDVQDKGMAELKTEWGEAFTERQTQVGKMLELQKAPAALQAAFKSGKVDAASARWLYDVLSSFGDEPIELTQQGKRGGSSLITQTEALERVDEIEKKIRDMNPGSPEYEGLVQRRIQLLAKAYPD